MYLTACMRCLLWRPFLTIHNTCGLPDQISHNTLYMHLSKQHAKLQTRFLSDDGGKCPLQRSDQLYQAAAAWPLGSISGGLPLPFKQECSQSFA